MKSSIKNLMKSPIKSLPCALNVVAAFFIAGFLFFACTPFAGDSYGTLVIALPENSAGGGDDNAASHTSARAAVSGAFAATLTYSVGCTGPGGSVSREARPGSAISIPLDPGDWTVTVTALNAAGQNIGSAEVSASIESGQTTAVTVPLSIDISRSDITRFSVTGPVSAAGAIDPDSRDISVSVPAGTNVSAVYFSLTHTGVSVSPASGPLDFSSARAFTVTAENGNQKTWTVTVTVDKENTPPPNTQTWPANDVLQSYGLSGLTQPAGTTISLVWVTTEELGIQLGNPNAAVYNALVSQIESLTGSTGTNDTSMTALGLYAYDLAYIHSGGAFDLNITCFISTDGGDLSSNTLILTVTNASAGGSYTWPDTAKWTPFGLSGLTQPSGAVVTDVTDQLLPYTALSVTLESVSDAAYDNLYNQIYSLFGAPDSSSGSPGDSYRNAAFMIYGTNTILVELSIDSGFDEITIDAIIVLPQ
ncbi:MAG: DUF5018 domain-containing protein [Treponema sp.]|jgi:hypothetical protein|nr:DUF5018 domain-containing protein [Treponema sp.]